MATHRPELASFASEYAVHVDHWREAIDDYDETAALVCASIWSFR
jgi:hypothetical protein